MDQWDKADIGEDIRTIDRLLQHGIFAPANTEHPLFRAAFIQMLIALRDLMYKAEKHASRIAFTDDVKIIDEVHDVTDLIKYVRNALCHPDSDNHYLENGNIKSTFNVVFFGSQRIFLRRHILRAYDEAKGKLLPLLSAS